MNRASAAALRGCSRNPLWGHPILVEGAGQALRTGARARATAPKSVADARRCEAFFGLKSERPESDGEAAICRGTKTDFGYTRCMRPARNVKCKFLGRFAIPEMLFCFTQSCRPDHRHPTLTQSLFSELFSGRTF